MRHGHSRRRYSTIVLALGLLLPAFVESAESRWLLVYGRQYGEFMTGGVAGQTELFAFQEDGRPARIGMTNRYNADKAIFGQTDSFGNSRITFDIHNRMYDFHVYDPTTPSDESPDCCWLDELPHYGHYRFEFHWRKVPDAASVTTFPFDPAYHYDRVVGFNQPPNREVAGLTTDAYELTDWDSYQAQTFVVPKGRNRAPPGSGRPPDCRESLVAWCFAFPIR